MSAASQCSTISPTRRATTLGLALTPLGIALGTCGPAQARPLGALTSDREWLNSRPLRAEDMQGRVVLVNFWTYTCINSLRPLPYLCEWAQKYADRGLIVIGVHSPEFSFEHEPDRVRAAVGDLGVAYPVVLDGDLKIWRAFANEAWPGFYLLEPDGRVRRRWLGEGQYAQIEQAIQDALGKQIGRPLSDPIAPITGTGSLAEADWIDLRSPETYVGYAKAERFASSRGLASDVAADYVQASALALNHWTLDGIWNVGAESAALVAPGGRLAFQFHARDLHLVMSPGDGGQPVDFRVRLDGLAPGADHGGDCEADGAGRLAMARMHQLVRQVGPVRERRFEIEFLGPGPKAYCFTFG